MVENAYFASMDDQIAERTSLQQELMAVYGGSLDSKYKVRRLAVIFCSPNPTSSSWSCFSLLFYIQPDLQVSGGNNSLRIL